MQAAAGYTAGNQPLAQKPSPQNLPLALAPVHRPGRGYTGLRSGSLMYNRGSSLLRVLFNKYARKKG